MSGLASKTLRCNLCKNHDIIMPLKSHKYYCKFRNCTCDACVATTAFRETKVEKNRLKRYKKCDLVHYNYLDQPSSSQPVTKITLQDSKFLFIICIFYYNNIILLRIPCLG